jgi:hypothetical protein
MGIYGRKKCCSGNYILKLVEKLNINKLASAVHLARSDVYHTTANHAHEEPREILKFGIYLDTAEVVTYFDHKNVFTSKPARIKVSCSSEHLFVLRLNV